jgi:hypothetical protein
MLISILDYTLLTSIYFYAVENMTVTSSMSDQSNPAKNAEGLKCTSVNYQMIGLQLVVKLEM